MIDLKQISAASAAAMIRQDVITSEQLVAECLERIRERDPVVQAWQHLDPDHALNQARAADAMLRSGKPLGPLHGVPVGIKDVIDTADFPTEFGTPIFAGRRPTTDALLVARLRAAGAVILGKTVTTELAFYGPGKTRNPNNPEHTPGGSSSGSAAAVADGQVPLALGTQTAGSILRPASYCGTIGFKPTHGTVPAEGALEQSLPLDTIGGYGRTIEDVALFIAVMSGSPVSVTGADGLRLAFVKTPAWPQGEPSMHAAFEEFVRRHKGTIDEVNLAGEFDTTGGLQRAVQFRDIAKNFGSLLDSNPGRLSSKLAEVITEGRTVTDAEYAAACARRGPLNGRVASILSRYDAIITPASTGPAPKGLASTGSPAFNFLWTFLGLPAISLPLLLAHGLPLGVQLVGGYGQDGRLLGTAKSLLKMCGMGP